MRDMRILVITQMYPSGSTGTSVKTLHTLKLLAREGYTIDVCCPHYNKMVKIKLATTHITVYPIEKTAISKLSIKYLWRVWALLLSWKPFRVIKLYDQKIDGQIASLCEAHTYTYIFFDGFSTLQYSRFFRKNNIYIDDEDITDLMKQRQNNTPQFFLKGFFFIEWLKCLVYERVFFPRVAQVWAISSNTQRRLAMLSKAKMFLMPTVVPKQKKCFHTKSKDIVFSGLLSWQENVVGLTWFLTNCWPSIHASFPDIQFYITGQMADIALVRYIKQFQNVTLLGFVPDLSVVYSRCALAIAPLFINAGIKVKILTYLSFGLPVVANKEATWGMIETKGVVITSKDFFSQAVVHMLQQTTLRKKLSAEGRKNIDLHHSEKILREFFFKTKVLS